MTQKPSPKDRLDHAEKWFRGQMPADLVNHDPAGLPGGMRMRDEKTRIAQSERFLEKDENFRNHNQHLSPSSFFSNALSIIHPSVVGYGPEHGKNVSQLAVYIAQIDGEHNTERLEILKAAGLMHDLGRSREWNRSDPDHGQKSAERADRTLRMDTTGSRLGVAIREGVCGLIANHSLTGRPPQDPLARALWDADCLEVGRHGVNTPDGRKLVVERYATLLSPWAQRKPVQEKVLKKFGWDLEKWGLKS